MVKLLDQFVEFIMYIKVNNIKYKLDNLTVKQFKELISSLELSNKEINFKRLGV